jgi:3-oxoacyl-[acyl-carrier-protein] synthase-3
MFSASVDGPRVYVSSLAYELGERVAIDSLADPVVIENLTRLHSEGMAYCRVSADPAFRLAASAAEKSLTAAASTAPGKVIYCAEVPGGESFCYDIWDFLLAADLPTLPSMVVSGNACGNVPPALRIARDTTNTVSESSTLLVATNRRPYATRYLDDGQTVISDGAASCLVSPHHAGTGFEVLGIAEVMRADFPLSQPRLARMRAVIRGIASCLDRLSKSSPECVDSFDLMVTGNYGVSVQQLFATASGMDLSAIYAPTASDVGHCSASDLLINLAHAEQADVLRHGTRVLLLGTSPRSWSCVALQYVCEET